MTITTISPTTSNSQWRAARKQMLFGLVGLALVLVLTAVGANLGVPNIGELAWDSLTLLKKWGLYLFDHSYAVFPLVLGIFGMVWTYAATRKPFKKLASAEPQLRFLNCDKVGFAGLTGLFAYNMAQGQAIGSLVFSSGVYWTAYAVALSLAFFPFGLWLARNKTKKGCNEMKAEAIALSWVGGYVGAHLFMAVELSKGSPYPHWVAASSGHALMVLVGGLFAIFATCYAAWLYAVKADEDPVDPETELYSNLR